MSINTRPYLFFDGSAGDGWSSSASLEAPWSGTDFYDKFVFCHKSTPPHFWMGTGENAVRVPGLELEARFDGVTVVGNKLVFWAGDTITHSDVHDYSCYIPVVAASGEGIFTLTSNFIQPAAGETVAVTVGAMSYGLAPTPVENFSKGSSGYTVGPFTVGQFVRLDELPLVNFYKVVGVTEVVSTTFAAGTVTEYVVTLKLLNKSGRTASGEYVNSRQLEIMPVNEAGELHVVGDGNRNGPISKIVQLSDNQAFIFKRRWVGSLQYVGKSSGVFTITDAINDDGLIGPNAVCKISSQMLVFLGSKELYQMSTGEGQVPLAQQATSMLFDDLDRSKLGMIRIFHNSEFDEYWVVYPSLSHPGAVPRRVFIYNYMFKSSTMDDYDESFGPMGAVARLTWEQFIAWTYDPISAPVAWEDDPDSWDSDSSQQENKTVVAFSGKLYEHGVGFARDGQAIHSEFQTIDFDFGDDTCYKYLDTVYFGLQIKNKLSGTNKLHVQAGGRDNLDSDIRWSGDATIDVSGNAAPVAKVNIRRSGRYLRVKFFSESVGIEWRVSSFRLIARKGGTY